LNFLEGHVVGQIVNAGRSSEIVSDHPINDNEWHTIYWEADPQSMRLIIDRKEKTTSSFYILPSTYTYIVGQIRSLYLCGKEVILGQMVRKANPLGVQIGDTGYCHINRCYNGGKCVELYDTYKCNCSKTPFTGDKCEQGKKRFLDSGKAYCVLKRKVAKMRFLDKNDHFWGKNVCGEFEFDIHKIFRIQEKLYIDAKILENNIFWSKKGLFLFIFISNNIF
jgi:hypothetical protein